MHFTEDKKMHYSFHMQAGHQISVCAGWSVQRKKKLHNMLEDIHLKYSQNLKFTTTLKFRVKKYFVENFVNHF